MANTKPPLASFAPDLLAGQVAFVAGGTSGINLEIAKAFAALGAKVAVASRKIDKVNSARAEISGDALGFAVDVRDYAAVQDALAQTAAAFGPLTTVVSGAAGNFVAPAAAMSANAFKTVIDIDLLGTFNVFRAAFDVAEKPGCSMIAISAPQSMSPYFGQAHVCAAKAGIDMLTRALAMEWGASGVRVNAIIPGPIDGTEGMARLAPNPAIRAITERSTALKRFGEKSDIAAMAAFLASPAARYVTGAIMACDGGQLLSGGGALSPEVFFGSGGTS